MLFGSSIHYLCGKPTIMNVCTEQTNKKPGNVYWRLLIFVLLAPITTVAMPASDIHQKSLLSEYNKKAKKYWDSSLDSACYYSRKAVVYARKNHIVSEQSAKACLYLAVALFYQSRYDSAVYYAVKGLDISDTIHSKWGEGFATNLLCVLERRRARYQQAIDYGLRSAKIREQLKDTFNLAGAYQNLANIYSLTGKPLIAIDYLSKSLELYLATNDTAGLRLVHGNIGNLYLDMKDKENGKEHILRALALDNKKELNYADNSLSLGTICLEFDKEYDSALLLFYKARKIYKNIGIEDGVATADENIGLALIHLGKSKMAFGKLKNAESIFTAIGDSGQIANVSLSLGKYYLSVSDFDSATLLLNKALKTGQRFKRSNVVNESLHQLYNLYKLRGRPEKALSYFEKYTAYQDSLEKVLISSRLKNMESKYQNVQKERQIELLKHEKEKIQWQKARLLYLLFSVIVVAFISGLLLYLKNKKERQIAKQQKELLIQKRKLAEKELETKRILQKEMEQEIEFKSKQLSTHALNMVQKNKVLGEVKQHLEEISGKVKPEFRPNLKKINLLLARHMKTDKEWNLFKIYFEQVNKNFFQNLTAYNPKLNTNDLRHCALIKLNLNVKEAASLLNVSPHTVKSARYRLKKKLNIMPDGNLGEFIRRI